MWAGRLQGERDAAHRSLARQRRRRYASASKDEAGADDALRQSEQRYKRADP
jgi:hypothetical protein